jgi:hypothetical protein
LIPYDFADSWRKLTMALRSYAVQCALDEYRSRPIQDPKYLEKLERLNALWTEVLELETRKEKEVEKVVHEALCDTHRNRGHDIRPNSRPKGG